MNPLQRRLFRLQQPGMSRQPMGILASSPQLMTAAQKAMMQGQPMQAQTGASVNTGRKVTVSGQEYTINNQGVFDSRGAPVTNPNVISMIQKQNVIDAANPVSGMLRQFEVGDVNMSAALSDAAGRKPVGQSEGGQERSAKIGEAIPEASVGDVSLGNALSDFSGRQPIGQSEGGRERSAALADAPSKITSGLAEGFGTIFDLPEAKGYAVGRVRTPAEVKQALTKATLGPELLPTEQELAASLQDIPPIGPADMPLDPGFQKAIAPAPYYEEEEQIQTSKNKAPEGPVILTPEITEKIAASTEGFDEDGADMNLVAQTGQSLADQAKSLIGSPLSAEGINKQIDQILGIDAAVQQKTGKPATKKERIKAEVALLKDALGDDAAKDIRTSGSYNLMMAGLMIAAGESPNAMTNIAKGLASGLKSYGDAAGEEAQRKNKLEQSLGLQAFSNVTQEIAAEKLAEAKTKELKADLAVRFYVAEANNQAALERLVTKEGFDAARFQQTLKLQTDQLRQQLEIAKMPPAEIRTLIALQQRPELIEIMSEAALAKNPYQLEIDLTKHLAGSPLFSMELMKPGGAEKLTSIATLMADSYRKSRGLTTGAAPAAPETTGAAPVASSLPVSGLTQRQKDQLSGAPDGTEVQMGKGENAIMYRLEGGQLVPM